MHQETKGKRVLKGKMFRISLFYKADRSEVFKDLCVRVQGATNFP